MIAKVRSVLPSSDRMISSGDQVWARAPSIAAAI
jgi:hypothetical protein